MKSVADTYNTRRLMPDYSATDVDPGAVCNMRTSKKKRRKYNDTSGGV
jgi:hypothetical protein